MLIETNAAIQSLRVISDWLSANKSLNNYNELSSAIAEIHSKLASSNSMLLTCQEKQQALTNRIADLEKKLTEHDDFKREIERYALHKLKAGMLVYALKPDMTNGEPFHYLCNKCKEDGKLSKLQSINDKVFFCGTCGAQGFA